MAKVWKSDWNAHVKVDGKGVLEARFDGMGDVLVTMADSGDGGIAHAIPTSVFKDWAETVLKQIGD